MDLSQIKDADWQIIQQIQNGDVSSFHEIFHRHKSNIINLAFRFTRSREAAEDIAQDIFIKIYEGKAKFNPNAKFTTWLYRVTVNASIDFIRRRKFSEIPSNITAEQKDHPAEEEIKAMVQSAIDSLPEKFRSPILLFQFEEMSHREIASVLGITEKAVERRISRAKEALRKKLGGLL